MAIKLRHTRYWLQVWVPDALRPLYDGKRHIERNLETSDRRIADQRAGVIEGLLKAEYAEHRRGGPGTAAELRRVYEATMAAAAGGEFIAHVGGDAPDPVTDGIEFELGRMADTHGPGDLSPMLAARVAALQDASAKRQGQKPARRAEYEHAFGEVAADFMRLWKAQAGTKVTNTEQQKCSTFALFKGFWSDKPMRSIGPADAAAFHDAMRLLDPHWARKPGAGALSWDALLKAYGGRARGLSDATINRHLAALKSLWDWARKRGHCEGENPFEGYHTKLRAGVNVAPYVAWDDADLNTLLARPPRRRDLLEVMLVAMHSGMRLDEIAALTWGQVRAADGIPYFQVVDAKTPAGNRQVPIHPALSWLLTRSRGEPAARVWPAFNPEGPGKKPGADAGRDFSRFKAARGFTSRTKAFHSFRKSVTRMMERGGVPENDWAQVFGHERGFTYRVYNPDGIALSRKAEMIELIAYPGVALPFIA